MQARGITREIIKKVGEIQDLVGNAKALHEQDTNQLAYEAA